MRGLTIMHGRWRFVAFMALMALLAASSALAQTLQDLRRSAEGVPVVWRATVSGDLNLQLTGPGRLHVVGTRGGGPIVTLHLGDEARQLRQPMGSGLLINGLFTEHPEIAALPLNLGPFEDLHVPGRGRLALETAIEPRVRVSATSGALQVHRLEDGFEASFSGILEQAGTPPAMRTIASSSIEGQICQVAEADLGLSWHEVDCFEPEEELFVEHFEPEHRRENVDHDRPPLIMTFSDRVRASDLQEYFSLHTRSRSGTRIEVAGRVRAESAVRLVFEPDQVLRPGVIYEARIAGGEHGLKSRDGATLAADHRWRFSTIVNLDQQSQAEDGPLNLNVFQTTRNAALVPDKPTMTRLSVDWQEHEDIDPAWQVTSFPALVELSHPHARIVDHLGRYFVEGESLRVLRPDRFTDEDRRMARNTINFFGWFPSRFDAVTDVTAAVEPDDPYPSRRAEPIRVEAQRQISIWPHQPYLRFHYARVLIGAWEDGVPPEDVVAIRNVVRAAEIFATQTLPVVNTRGIHSIADLNVNLSDRWGGDHESRLEQARDLVADTFQWEHYYARVLYRVIKYAHDRMLGHLAPNDIFAVFHPFVTSRQGQVLDWGEAISGVYDLHPMELDGTPYRYRMVRLPIQHNLSTRRLSHGLVHEFGHTFGLHHHPANASEMNEVHLWAPGRSAGIEGFRLAPSGLTGWNKSAAEGNAESPYHLAPLMWPDARDEREIFILDAHYEQVKRVLEREAHLWGFRQQPAWFAAIDSDWLDDSSVRKLGGSMASNSPGRNPAHHGPNAEGARAESYRTLIGALRPDGSEAWIASIHRSPRPLESADGPFLAELQDAAGRVLSAVRFGGQADGALGQHREAVVDLLGSDDPLIWAYFSISLPDDPRAHRVVIRNGDRVIAERSRAEALPDARLDVPEGFVLDGLTGLGWHVARGIPRHFDLLYSPDGAEPWQVLRFESTATETQIDARKLQAGFSPTLRLIASDGFDESVHDVSVKLVRRPDVALSSPAAGDPLDPSHPVEVSFDVAMDPDSVRGGLRLVRLEDGQEVPSTVVMGPTGLTAALLPENRLTSAEAYQVVLSAGLEDAFGNRMGDARIFEFRAGATSEVSAESFFDDLPELTGEASESAESNANEHELAVTARLYVDGQHETDFLLLACTPEPENEATPVLQGREITEQRNPGEIFLRRRVGPDGVIEEIEFRSESEPLRVQHFKRAGTWFDERGNPAAPIATYQEGRMTLMFELIHPDSGVPLQLRIEADCP